MIPTAQVVAAGLVAINAVHALPQAAQPSATLSPTPAPANGDGNLLLDLLTVPTALKRFQRLLVQEGSLINGDALRKSTVFSFNGAAPNPGAKGGATKSAVRASLLWNKA
jgi:hypothetical protein